VRSARVTPEQVRLVVDAEGIGVVDAVAPLGGHAGAGERISLRVDVTRLAPLPGMVIP
jgi:thiamine transport system ATP-binding protein